MQLVVLTYSAFCYDEKEEPYSLMVIDSFIAVLLIIEVRAHYVSMPETFWSDQEMQFDAAVSVVSVAFIGFFFLVSAGRPSDAALTPIDHVIQAKEGIVDIPEEFDAILHL